MTPINRLPTLLILTALLIIFLAACGGAENNAQIPPFLLTATATAGRGSESEEDPPAQEEAQAGEAEVQTAEPVAQENSAEENGQAADPFEVRPDGFGFRNYGAGFPEGDFTITDLWDMFGDGVCSRIDGDKCLPTAEAQQWITDRNADMAYGHCIGFTVASYRFYDGDFQPQTFSSDADVPFDIEQEAQIMRTIAANGALYWVDSVWSSEVSGTPTEVVEALIALDEPVDLSIFLPGLSGGHSLLAYDVVEVEPQIFHINVYDNNYPGEESYVIVDTAANTWRYDHGAINPDVQAVPYEGDATTNTLRFIPLSAYDNAACPFCPVEAEEEAEQGFSLLSFLGRGQALVTTDAGSAVLESGRLTNEIVGAQFIHQRGQLSADDIPDLALPAGTDFTLQFNDLQRVSSLNDTFSLVIEGLPQQSGNNLLTVGLEEQVFDYQAGGTQAPVLKATFNDGATAYNVTLLGAELSAGQDLSIGLTPGGDGLTLFSEAVQLRDATLLIGRLTAVGESIFGTSTFDFVPGQTVALDIGSWDGLGLIDLFADTDGDGIFDQLNGSLANQPLDQLLGQSETAQVAAIVGTLGPFLDDQGLQTVLSTLPGLGLSGETLGQILQPLQLNDDQLLNVISAAALPVADLSEFIFNLRLDQGRQDGLIPGIGLQPADQAALEASLADLAFYHDILIEWAFLDTADMTRLAQFLEEQNLSTDQIAELLPYMDLNAEQTEVILHELALDAAEIGKILGDSGFSPEELDQVIGAMDLDPEEVDALAEQLGLNLTVTPTATPTAESPTTVPATSTPAAGGTMTPTAASMETSTPSPTPGSTAEQEDSPPPTPEPSPTVEQDPLPSSTPPLPPDPYPGPEDQATPES